MGTRATGLPRSAQRTDVGARSITLPGVLLGLGLGGFFDGIVLHQLLQWHHMRSGDGTLGGRSTRRSAASRRTPWPTGRFTQERDHDSLRACSCCGVAFARPNAACRGRNSHGCCCSGGASSTSSKVSSTTTCSVSTMSATTRERRLPGISRSSPGRGDGGRRVRRSSANALANAGMTTAGVSTRGSGEFVAAPQRNGGTDGRQGRHPRRRRARSGQRHGHARGRDPGADDAAGVAGDARGRQRVPRRQPVGRDVAGAAGLTVRCNGSRCDPASCGPPGALLGAGHVCRSHRRVATRAP